jgi:hypothetical protein
VCIDACGGDVERSRDDCSAALVPGIAARFDGNVAAFGTRTHVEKLKRAVRQRPAALGCEGRRFGIARVDGSHYATDVCSGAVLTRSLMTPGGIVIFGVYAWEFMDNDSEHPKPRIDAFLHAVCSQSRAIRRDCQVVIAKT